RFKKSKNITGFDEKTAIFLTYIIRFNLTVNRCLFRKILFLILNLRFYNIIFSKI
ncbi:uncharacterized protein BO95DRAFT_377225, partial [Aspergillus brunneoviolaceus CBS 621.78]